MNCFYSRFLRFFSSVILMFLFLGTLAKAKDVRSWFPPGVKTVRGALLHQGGFGNYNNKQADEEWQRAATIHRFAIFATDYQVSKDTAHFFGKIREIAQSEGHPELMNIPFCVAGHSFNAGHARGFLEKVPKKTVSGVIVNISGGPVPDNEDIKNTPAVFVANEQDFVENTVVPGFQSLVEGGQWATAMRPGTHSFADANLFIRPFHDQTLSYRIPDDWDPLSEPVQLRDYPLDKGWIVVRDPAYNNRKTGLIAPMGKWDRPYYSAGWMPNKYLAHVWRAWRVRESRVLMFSPSGNSPNAVPMDQVPSIQYSLTNATGVKRLILYDGDIPLQITENPGVGSQSYEIENPSPGFHVFLAVAEMEDGSEETSGMYSLGVLPNQTDIKINSHWSGDRIVVGQAQTIRANAFAHSGSVSKVVFSVNGSETGSDDSAPFEMNWTPGSTGEYLLQAQAENSNGEKTPSRIVRVEVIDSPIATRIQPKPGLAVLAPGQNEMFTAIIRDQYGFAMPQAPSITWSATDGGSIETSGLLTAGDTHGKFSITASAAGLSSTIPFHVTNTLRFNFQPDNCPIPAGFIPDFGLRLGDRENGMEYGWSGIKDEKDKPRDIRAQVLRPYLPNIPLEYATFAPMHSQFAPPWNKTWQTYYWDLVIPNGEYTVRIVMGDQANQLVNNHSSGREGAVVPNEHYYQVMVEDVLVVDGKPSIMDLTAADFSEGAPPQSPWLEGTADVTVSDGKLTIRGGESQQHNKINFIEIAPKGSLEHFTAINPVKKITRPKLIHSSGRLILGDLEQWQGARAMIFDVQGKILAQATVRKEVLELEWSPGTGRHWIRLESEGRNWQRALFMP